MASRHDIIHIDFEANAGKVSPALKAIQNSAIETRKAVEEAKQALAELEKAGTDTTAIEAQRKKVNALQRDVKSLEQAEREYVKGISTLDKAIKAFNDGTLSQMSAAFQKAAYNAAKLAQTKLVPSDKDYKKSMEELNALMQRNLENMAKARMQTEDLLKAIEGGGKVSASWIRTEKQNLEELLDVIPKGTAEWNEYSAQLTKIKDYVQTLSETERRLAGEIVNADDARKMAAQLTKEGAEAVARERKEAEDTIAAQKEKIAGIETERQERLKSTQALSAQVAAEANEIELKKQAIATMEEEAKAAGEVSATKKQEAEDARAAAETMKQTAKEETENLELQKKATQSAADEVTRLKGEIEKLNAEPVKPKVDVSEIDELSAKLDELKKKRNIEVFEGMSYMQLESESRMPYDFELEKSDYVQKFLKKFGLEESYAKRKESITSKHMFHGPEDSTVWDIEDWYNGEENGWGMTKEDWKKLLDDYHWFDDNLHKVIESIRAQYEKLGQAMREGIDPESLKGIANGIKKLEALKERMLAVAQKDGSSTYGIGAGEWFRQQFGDVEGDMKKAIETVERGLKDVTGKRSAAYKKELEERRAHWEEQADNSEKTIREYEREIKTIELTIAAIKGETGALEEQERVIENLKQEHLGLVNAQVEAHRKNELLTTGETFSASGEKLTDIRAFQQRIIEEAQKISPYTTGDLFLLDQDQTKTLVENLAKQYEVTYKEMEDRLRAVFNGNQGEGSLFSTSGFDTTFGQYYVNFERNWEAVYKFKEEVREAAGAVEEADRAAEASTQKYMDAQRALNDAKKNAAEITDHSIETTQASVEVDKQKEELQRQLEEAEKKHADELGHLEQQQKNADKATADAAKADEEAKKKEQELAEATAETSKKLEEEQKALEGLESAHDSSVKKLQEEQQALQEYDDQIQKESQALQEAEVKKAQSQELTVKRMEEIVAMLEKENRDTIPANTEKWKKNQQQIDELNEAIKVAKGEWMSYAEAEKFAQGIGTDGFIATSDQLQKATQSLYRYRDALIKTIQQKRDDGKATAEEEAELKKVETELKKMKFEMDNANMSSKRMHEILKDPKSAKNIEELSAAIKRSTQELKLMEETVGRDNAKYKEMAEQTKKATIAQKEMEAQFKASASAFDKAWSRLKTYVGLYVGAAVAMQKITATMGDLMELSDKMGEVRKTTGFTADEVGRLSDNLKKLDVRTSLTSLMELSSLAGSVGLKTQEDVQGFTEAANQLMIALPEMGNESARTLIKIAQATGDLQKNNNDVRETLEKVGSTIIALRANSASAAGPITDFVSRVGAVGAQAGISIDQIAALGSTIDALGGRVEMSATALSRMIPAIRNNAFGVANAIGVTEKTLTDLFNQGKAMEAMVLIFEKMRESVKQFDTTTEEGQEAMANNVEELLGKNAAMADVMKELNQQGARAGIVFGLLSQNVDELKEQLGIAGEAYRDNIALQEEFNKMNETTAAKWERLKNTFEEMFVSDSWQRFLGGVIEQLRKLVEFIAEDGPIAKGLKVILTYLIAFKIGLGSIVVSAGSAFKALGTAFMAFANTAGTALGSVGASLGLVTARTQSARMEWKKMETAMKANIWGALIAAIGMIIYKLYELHQQAKEAAAEVGRFNQKLSDEKKALADLFVPLEKGNVAQKERSRLITEINSKYSKYLGYMLSETTSAQQLAEAHRSVALAIQEEALRKRILGQEEAVREKHASDINAAYGGIENAVRGAANGNANVQDITDSLKRFIDGSMGRLLEASATQAFSSTAVGKELDQRIAHLVGIGQLTQEASRDVYRAVAAYAKEARSQTQEMQQATANSRADLRNTQREMVGTVTANLNTLVDNLKNFGQRQQSAEGPGMLANPGKQKTKHDWSGDYGTQSTVQIPLPSWKPTIDKNNIEQVKRYVEAQDQLRGYLVANAEHIDEDTRKTAEMYLETEDEMKKLRALLPAGVSGGTGGGGGRGDKPYGTFNRVTDPYEKWDADSLVARRKEMLERVRALANGADVQKVLSEDAKFITEATRKNIKTTKDAIEWYNQERLKIQEALHARYLTNTGDWMDPKSNNGARKSAEKAAKEEMKAALDALDAYYNERDADIKEVLNSGEITEAEIRRRTLKNDMEHYKRREELRRMFLKDTKNISQQEQDEIYRIIDTENVGVDQVKKEFENTVKFIDKLSTYGSSLRDGIRKNMTRDMQLQQTTVSKYQKSIDAILRKGFDSADKAYEQFIETLDTLGIMLGGSTDTMEEFLTRAQHLSEYVRDAYKFADGEELYEQMKKDSEKRLGLLEISLIQAEESEQASIQARIVEERNYYNWLIQTDKDAHAQMLSQLIEYSDNYEEAIRKIAKQEERLAEQRYGKSTAGRKMDKDIKAQKDNQTTIGNRNDLATTGNIGGTGTFGQADALRAEIKLMDLEIERKKALMEIERKQAEATQAAIKIRIKAYQDEIALMDQQLAGMQESDPEYQRITADRTKANENLAGAQQQLDAAVAVSNQTMADQMKELDDLTLNRALKMQEMTKIVTDTVGEYLQELDTFAEKSGELIGSGLWGDKEERQAASKELLTEVAKTSKKLIQQWLTNLVMKQFIAQKEVQVEQATATASNAIKAGQTINDLTIEQAETTADVAAGTAKGAAKEFGSKGIFGAATAAAIGLALSLLLGMVLGKINKAKSQVAAAGGTQAGRLATGMQTYAEGNVNEFSDPNSLTPGRQYNVDGADGRTYRARYMGKDAKTHITNGPEFHLVGEKGREAIIDAETTRQIQMNNPEIWRSIQVLYNGGSLSHTGRRGRGVRTFAAGNIDEFDTALDGSSTGGMDMAAMQASLDRNSAATEALVAELAKGIKSTVSPYGKDGIVHGYDRGKAEAKRHGLSYIP